MQGYFNPRPPRGGRPDDPERNARHHRISIHVLREEDDIALLGEIGVEIISIHVLREEDDNAQTQGNAPYKISIHVLREEDDAAKSAKAGT